MKKVFDSKEKKRKKRDESSKWGDGSIERLAVAFHSQISRVCAPLEMGASIICFPFNYHTKIQKKFFHFLGY